VSELPKGFTCGCGEYHAFVPYVYAHWDIVLNFECPKCKRKYSIRAGHASELGIRRRRKRGSGSTKNTA